MEDVCKIATQFGISRNIDQIKPANDIIQLMILNKLLKDHFQKTVLT